MKQSSKDKVEALQDRLRLLREAKAEAKKNEEPGRAPRYDALFVEGMAWLNGCADDPDSK